MVDNLVILAAGLSSRMKRQSNGFIDKELKLQANDRPKSLISIDGSGRPFLDYILYNAKRVGFLNIYIVISPNDPLIRKFYGDDDQNNKFGGLTINYAIQGIPQDREKPLGTADALLQALEQFPVLQKNSFVVCNSDNLYSSLAFKILSTTEQNALISYDRDALKFSLERINQFALMRFDDDYFLKDIIEKPSIEDTEKYRDKQDKLRVSMNIFRFNGSEIYNYLKNCPLNPDRGEKELPTALLNMISDKPLSVKGIPLSEHVPDLTSKEDIAVLKDYLLSEHIKISWE